jgi:hypothetical protein
MADTAAHLVDRVLPEVSIRQWVFERSSRSFVGVFDEPGVREPTNAAR